MNSPPAPVAPSDLHDDAKPASAWQVALLWVGLPLCLLGMFLHRLWEQWHPGRFGELLVLSLCSLAFASPLRRFADWSWATAVACPWVVALLVYAGLLPVAATTVLAMAAMALGGWIVPRESIALQLACGLVVLGATLAWLLPVPLHHAWSYALLAAALVGWRRRQVLAGMRAMCEGWRVAVAGSPRMAALAVLAFGLASTGCWLPTMQVDDLGYHLRLPWELQQQARYAMDPETHVWALAPWLADVVQAFAQILAGTESRGAINALWMLLTSSGVWHLGRVLGADARAGWAGVALYASLPLTAALAGSMQTEVPTAALLVWVVVLIARSVDAPRSIAPAGAILFGGLLALKLAAAAMAIVLLPWALWKHRKSFGARIWLTAPMVALAIGSSSYVYATVLSGNPFLPLFNDYFRSPYFQLAGFDDERWHAGFNAWLPWNMTFDTGRYLEAFAGGGGFVLIAMLGGWWLALLQRRSFAIALMLALSIAAPLVAMQYLRYVFPACVALSALLAVTALRTDPRRGKWLLAMTCLLNLAFQSNGHWMLRTGAVKETMLAWGNDEASFRHYAPERLLIARLRAAPGSNGNVLALDPDLAFSAETGMRARTTSRYDHSLATAAVAANLDGSGQAWLALLRREQVGEVLLRKKTLTASQRAGLQLAGATLQAEEGDAQWWRLASPEPAQ